MVVEGSANPVDGLVFLSMHIRAGFFHRSHVEITGNTNTIWNLPEGGNNEREGCLWSQYRHISVCKCFLAFSAKCNRLMRYVRLTNISRYIMECNFIVRNSLCGSAILYYLFYPIIKGRYIHISLRLSHADPRKKQTFCIDLYVSWAEWISQEDLHRLLACVMLHMQKDVAHM